MERTDRETARELGRLEARMEIVMDDVVRALENLRSGRRAEAEKILSRVVDRYGQ